MNLASYELSFEDIFDGFRGSVTDPKMANLGEDDQEELLSEYLAKAVRLPYFRRLFSSFELDEDSEEIIANLSYETNEDSDFVFNCIIKLMIVEWMRPMVYSKINIIQFFGGKEQNFFSQANHNTSVKEMFDGIQSELRKDILDRVGYANDYLGDS